MAGTRLRGGSRSLARSGLTRNEKYNVGAAVRGKEELSRLPGGERFLFHVIIPHVQITSSGVQSTLSAL